MTMVEMPDKVIQGEVVEATDKVQAPRLLSDLRLAKLNAQYYKLVAVKQNAESINTQLQMAQMNVNIVQSEFTKELEIAQKSVGVAFKEWDLNTGQLK